MRKKLKTSSCHWGTKIVCLLFTALLGFSLLGVRVSYADSSFTPLNKETAQKIANGQLRYPDGRVDPLLYGKEPLDPNADDDGDGIKNRDEIGTKIENGKTILVYKTHPRLKDTDGDGQDDASDEHPLRWDISPRDAILFMKIAYRTDSEIDALLNPYLTLDQIGEQEPIIKEEKIWRYGFANMHNELSPNWRRIKTWRDDNGFDAQLYEFTNKTLPFLEPSSVHMVAIRGTAGREDVGDDTQLGTGLWPGQADTALKVADEVAQAGYKNVYATGHSLGGFLTQIFMVRSLGERFNLGYDVDKNKHDNRNVVKGYTFNAPRIKCSSALLNPWMCEYKTRGNQLNQLGISTHYVTANDPVTNVAGRFEHAIVLASSDNGHSSTSFFEGKYDGQWGFTFPNRPSLSQENQPPLDPTLLESRPLTTINFIRLDTGETAFTKQYALSEKEAQAYDMNEEVKRYNVANHTGWKSADRTIKLNWGGVNNTGLLADSFTFKYSFTLGEREVSSVTLNTRYLDEYTLPQAPTHSDPTKRYVPIGEIPHLKPNEIVSSRLITVPVKEVEVTSIDLQDEQGNSLRTVEKLTDVTDSTPITFSPADLPYGYDLPEVIPNIIKAQHNQIRLKKHSYRVTYRFMAQGKPVDEKTVLVRYQEDSSIPKLPEGYRLVSSEVARAVESDQNIDVQVEKISFEVRISFPGSPAPEQILRVEYGDSLDKLPELPEGYEPAGKVPEIPQNIKDNLELAIPVKLREVKVSYHYFAGTNLLKEDTEKLSWGSDSSYELDLPEGYVLAEGVEKPALRQVKTNRNIDLLCVRENFPVTLQYTHRGQVISVQNQQIEYDQKPNFTAPKHKQENITYEISGDFVWEGTIKSAQTIEIPLVERIPATLINPDTVKTSYRVVVEYVYAGKVVKTEEQKIVKGRTAKLVVPDGKYIIAPDFANPQITKATKISVPLQLKEPPVDKNPIDKNPVLKDRFNDIATYPFRAEINWLGGSGVAAGYADGGFHPHESVSRAAMAAFLYRFSGSPSYSPPQQSPFTDLNPSTPFYREICWLASTGITTGYKDGSFHPWDPINRDAMAAFLRRYDANVAETKMPLKYRAIDFKDITTNPFRAHIIWLSQTGITTGYDDGSYRPLQSIERGAIATFFYRMKHR